MQGTLRLATHCNGLPEQLEGFLIVALVVHVQPEILEAVGHIRVRITVEIAADFQ